MWPQINSVDWGRDCAIRIRFATKPSLRPFCNKHGSLRNRVLSKDEAGVPARDINAMTGERAAERKANIRELGYRSVELVRNLGRALTED